MGKHIVSESVSLAAEWSLADEKNNYVCNIEFPGDGISAMYDAGIIPNPYWGQNEYDLSWIAQRDWIAQRRIDLTDTDKVLVIRGLDTVATIYWNDTIVLEAQNVHRTYKVDLSEVAKKGSNSVKIIFHSPVKEAEKRQRELEFYIPSMHDHKEMGAMCPVPNGNMLRKQQCDFGWDWNIALLPFGIHDGIWLESVGLVHIDRISITQSHEIDFARVNIDVYCKGADGEIAQLDFYGKTQKVQVSNGVASTSFAIKKPRLWWPNGHGEQILHDCLIRVANCTANRRIGLREIELVTEPDDYGVGFKFRINGRDIFIKGANWVPADALRGKITPEKTRELLQSAADVHMNMIRVWGGGRYEADSFYDACDELGLMVWQDFMFACNLYPSTDEFLQEVKAEVKDNVGRIQHHACLALWCGDNEIVSAIKWFEESRSNIERYLVNYDRLNRTIENELKSIEPGANWWPSSPSRGPLDFSESSHIGDKGDMHFWSVWHEGKDFDTYRQVKVRFCSEFGFQSYPSMEVIETFAEPKDWNISSRVLESHQKNPGGNARIAETMFRYFRWPEKFENFVWLSQIQQAIAIKTAVTHWRGSKPCCMGTLYWQLNDTWPVCSWSSLNYGGSWKILHYFALNFYAPLSVVCLPVEGDLVLRVVNDTAEHHQLCLAVYAIDLCGVSRMLGNVSTTSHSDVIEIYRISEKELFDNEILVYQWENESGELCTDHFALQPYKNYELLDSRLTIKRQRNNLTISSTSLALFVTIEADKPGRFSDNAFTVYPSNPVNVRFFPEDSTSHVNFSVRDLYSSTFVDTQK